jgi:hypothetical protein
LALTVRVDNGLKAMVACKRAAYSRIATVECLRRILHRSEGHWFRPFKANLMQGIRTSTPCSGLKFEITISPLSAQSKWWQLIKLQYRHHWQSSLPIPRCITSKDLLKYTIMDKALGFRVMVMVACFNWIYELSSPGVRLARILSYLFWRLRVRTMQRRSCSFFAFTYRYSIPGTAFS